MKKILIASLLLPLTLFAGEDADSGALMDKARAAVAEKDLNGDGKLDAEELGVGAGIFAILDRNGDGFVTAGELAGAKAARRKQREKAQKRRAEEGAPGDAAQLADRFLERRDTNGDGKLSRDEMPQGGRIDFDALDRNGDGFLDSVEIRMLLPGGRKGPGARKGDRPGQKGDRPGPGGQPDPERVRKMSQGILERLDKDGDGRLSAEELPPEGRLDLSKADKNGDGFVDLFEITITITKFQGQRGQRARRGGLFDVEMLKRMDANQDGQIDREEWKGPEQAFRRLDADQDGAVSMEEIKEVAKRSRQWQGRPGEVFFRRMDADGDRKISREEWKLPPEHFAKFDRNGDGFVTPDEVMLWEGKRKRRGPDVRSGKGSAHFLQKFDKNGDGQITGDEFPHERRFAEIDANGDGVLSKEEIEEALDRQMRESMYGFFERFDLNRDGKVTREEFTGPAAQFEKKDKNHDGVIDASDRPDGE